MTDAERPVIHIVDDDPSLCTALNRLLGCAGFAVKSYRSAGEFLVSEPDPRPGCILLDMELGGPNGLELQQAVMRAPRALPIVFMSAYSDVPCTVKAIKAGAVDFLLKPFDRHALLRALQAALDSPPPLPAVVGADDRAALSERERTVLRCINAGKRNKEIAAELNLSERTIKSCRADIMRKFGATSLAELLQKANSRVTTFVQRNDLSSTSANHLGERGL